MAWSTPKVWAVGEGAEAADFNTFLSDNLKALAPVGSYRYQYRSPTRVETVVDSGWLEGNGAAVSRTTYAALFAIIGTTYGVGDGSTTFNLPDFAGRMPIGAGGTGSHSDVTTLGNSDGVALGSRRPKHGMTVNDPTHTHTGQTDSVNHNHGAPYPALELLGNENSGVRPSWSGETAYNTGGAGAHTHTTPASGASPAGSSLTIGVGTAPVDGPGYLVGGVWLIKYVA